MAGEKVIELNASNFEEEVLKSEVAVLVDFWALWCIPCQMVTPIVEQLAREYEGKVKFCKLNIEETPEIADRYSIMSIPTLLLFKEGKVVDRIIGAVPKQQIITKLNKIL